jgi:hypothetical protein
MLRIESETTITFNDEEKEATVFTCNQAMMRKLDGYCAKYPEQYYLIREDECSKTYQVPKRYISIRQPKILTEDQRRQMSERMTNARTKAM